MSGSVVMSFPVFWLYSLRAVSKSPWNCKNDTFGWEFEEDILANEMRMRGADGEETLVDDVAVFVCT